MEYSGIKGTVYRLENQSFSSGGEGEIYSVLNDKGLCAKIYNSNSISEETENKLKIMVENPPASRILSQIAWPLDLLYSQSGVFVGFIIFLCRYCNNHFRCLY